MKLDDWPPRQCTRCYEWYPGKSPACPKCYNPEFSLNECRPTPTKKKKTMATESAELYKKFRPKTLAEVVGQPDAVRQIESWGPRIPHSILFAGPSGCGKTSLARILRRMVGCHRDDFTEKNCADFKGIDTAREIRRFWMKRPLRKSLVWLLDEVHKSTGDFQHAMLKILEDTPPTVYFMLATTDPQKLLPTIRTRCTQIAVRTLSAADMSSLIVDVCRRAGTRPATETIDAIIEAAEGSPRKALVLLNSVIGISDPKQQLEAVQKSDTKNEAYEIFKALINPRTRWPELSKILQGADIEDPEGIRRLVLACCTTTLLKGGNARAAMIIDYFQKPWYDAGKAGLIFSCWEILGVK